jgi:hypothetical protein
MAASRSHTPVDRGADPPEGRGGSRPRPRARTAALALALLGLVASLLALVPASPATAAVTNPVLIVGGHMSQSDDLEANFANSIEGLTGLPDDKVRTVELRTQPGWDFPDDDDSDWPGTASNEASADDIRTAINNLSSAYGGARVEVIAISQGALATRRLLQREPAMRTKVASYISYSGVNAGIPSGFSFVGWLLDECEDDEGVWKLVVCEQMIYDPPLQEAGETEWIEDDVNLWDDNPITPNGDPTPGGEGETPAGVPGIAYFHIYTANDPVSGDDPDTGDEVEAVGPYGWSDPLLGARNMSAQDACDDPGLQVVHASLHPVLVDLVLDALNRRPFDPGATC